jgi:hypothetical protein
MVSYRTVANKPSMLSVVMLNVVMLNVVMLNVVMLNVVMLSVDMLNVVMLSVEAPNKRGLFAKYMKAGSLI